MGVRRKKPEPEPPPPPRAIAMDGSNVTASSIHGAERRLEQALSWCRAFGPSLPIAVFFDAATLRRLGPDMETRLRACAAAAGAEFLAAPVGASADPLLLAHAQDQRALLLSNDRFWEYEDLRRDVILLQFTCDAAGFRVPDEATWFLPSGAARRVAVAAIRPA